MRNNGNLIITRRPELRTPSMICGISGWINGGDSATGSIEYLVDTLGAKAFARVALRSFNIFQLPGETSLRPEVRIKEGILKEYHLAQNRFFYWINPNDEHDLILFSGIEPNLRWEEYALSILSIAEEFKVSRIYLLGGVLDAVPHTKEPDIYCTCSSLELKEEMQKYGVQFSDYEGPGSFETTLMNLCLNKHTQAVSLLTRVTYYPDFNIIISYYPRAIRALIMRLNSLCHLNLDISDLNAQVEEMNGKIEFMASQNPELHAYVQKLENEYVERVYREPLEISHEEGVRLAEEILKRERKG